MDTTIYTIIDKVTGEVYRCEFEPPMLAENEVAVTELLTEPMETPYFDFNTRTFYERNN